MFNQMNLTGTETQQQQTQSTSQAVAQPELIKPKVGSPRHFFSFRKGLFEQSVNDCINILLKPTNDTDLQGSWLLTEFVIFFIEAFGFFFILMFYILE